MQLMSNQIGLNFIFLASCPGYCLWRPKLLVPLATRFASSVIHFVLQRVTQHAYPVVLFTRLRLDLRGSTGGPSVMLGAWPSTLVLQEARCSGVWDLGYCKKPDAHWRLGSSALQDPDAVAWVPAPWVP